MAFDISAATPILKQYYTKKKIESLVFESELLKSMPKDTGGSGVSYIGAIRSAIPASVSATDTVAFATTGGSVYNQWVCPWRFGYGSANVTGEAIDKTANDAGAFVRALTSETEGAFKAIGQQLGAALFGNGGGAIGKIAAAGIAGSVLTLTDVNQVVNFWQNQVLQLASDDGTGGAGVRVGTVTVSAVDLNAGTVTMTGGVVAGIAAAAAGDYVFMNGNYNGLVQGIPAWIPDALNRPVLATLFNTVDRAKDGARLAGAYYNGGGGPKAESLNQLGMLVQRLGGRPTDFFCNPVDYIDVIKDAGSRIVINNGDKDVQVGFTGAKLATPFGVINIKTDIFCPTGKGWLLDMKTWLLVSMGALPKVDLADGMNWLRNAGADSYQFRTLYRAATYCSMPGHNGVVNF